MRLAAVGTASLLLLLAAAATAGAVTFEVINNATTTPGGLRFDRDYGVSYAAQVLSDASSFIWEVFNQTSPADRRPVDHVTLVVNAMDGIAYTDGTTIVLNAGYVNNYTGDVKTEVRRLPTYRTSTMPSYNPSMTSVRACVRAGNRGAVPRVGTRVAVGAAGLRRVLVGLRGDRRLRPAAGRLRAGALGAARAGERLGERVRRHGEVPGLLRLAPAGLRGLAQRQADQRLQRRLLRADPGEVRAGAVAGVQGQIRGPSVTE